MDVDAFDKAQAELLAEWAAPITISARARKRLKRRIRSEWPALAGELDLMTAIVLDDPEPTP